MTLLYWLTYTILCFQLPMNHTCGVFQQEALRRIFPLVFLSSIQLILIFHHRVSNELENNLSSFIYFFLLYSTLAFSNYMQIYVGQNITLITFRKEELGNHFQQQKRTQSLLKCFFLEQNYSTPILIVKIRIWLPSTLLSAQWLLFRIQYVYCLHQPAMRICLYSTTNNCVLHIYM